MKLTTRLASYGRVAWRWCAAVLAGAVTGSLIQSHLNLEAIREFGAPVSLGDTAYTYLHDLYSFMPAFGTIAAAAFLVLLPLSPVLPRRAGAWRDAAMISAGALGMTLALQLANYLLMMPTVIAATRFTPGYIAILGTGGLGGWAFSRLTASDGGAAEPHRGANPRERAHPRATAEPRGRSAFALLAPPVMIGAFAAMHFSARPSLDEPYANAELGPYRIEILADGLVHPWGLAHLPDGRMLVTERAGRLRIIDGEGALLREPVKGVPPVLTGGQGGLLDVQISPTFEEDGFVFLTYACGTRMENNTCISRSRLAGNALRDTKVIFRAEPLKHTQSQFGSRIEFLPDTTMIVTIGDGFDPREQAQDLADHLGTLIRIRMDGTAPPDNPFVDTPDRRPEIWSFGHRNAQGVAYDSINDRLYASEHGPRGGDEINVIEPGANYGWPVVTEGINYPGDIVSPHERLPGFEPPLHEWTPSIAPSGTALYRGGMFPQMEGDLLVTALDDRSVHWLEIEGGQVVREHRLFVDLNQRIRFLRVGPEGALYILTDHDPGQVLRVVPEPEDPGR